MKEFLITYYSIIIKSLELLAAITGLLYYKKFKNSYERFFIYFLIYVLLVENFGAYTHYINRYQNLSWIKEAIKGTVFQKNYWWYQIFWTINSTLFLCFFYKNNLVNKQSKLKFTLLGYGFFAISFFLIVLKWETLKYGFIKILDVLSFIITLFLISIYFFKTLKSEIILKFYKSLTFYISCGFLIFIILTTPLTFFESYFNTSDWSYITLKWAILFIANVFMYSTFILGLIVSKADKN